MPWLDHCPAPWWAWRRRQRWKPISLRWKSQLIKTCLRKSKTCCGRLTVCNGSAGSLENEPCQAWEHIYADGGIAVVMLLSSYHLHTANSIPLWIQHIVFRTGSPTTFAL